MKQKRVVIIGAGIGGLATANLLAQAGYQVSIYEKNNEPGGRAGLLKKDGFTFDTGPSWYLMPDVFAHYFSLLGKDINQELELIKLSPSYKVFFEEHDPVIITADPTKDAATFETIEPGAGHQLLRYIKKGELIYRLSLKHFLYTNFSSLKDFLHTDILRHAGSMVQLALTPIDRYVSTFVRDQRLKQILEYPMVFLGTSPFTAPALYSLMSALDFKEGVFYPQGGLYQIILRLVQAGQERGVTYHYGTNVTHITTDHHVAKGITLEDGRLVEADIIISNADIPYTEQYLLSKEDQSYPSSYWDKKEAGPSALLMYLGVKGDLPQLEHHNLFFVKDWKDNFKSIFQDKTFPRPASIYLSKTSRTDPSVAPRGYENLFVLVPFPSGISVEKTELQQLAESYLEQIESAFSLPSLQNQIVSKSLIGPNDFMSLYNSWQGTALGPSHILNQSAFFRTPNMSKKIKNLYYVGGSTTPGIGLPMCLIGAELIYKRLTNDKEGGLVSSINPHLGEE